MDLCEVDPANANRHPWEISRAASVVSLLRALPRTARYADVGSGDMFVARHLCGLTDDAVYAVDINYPEPREEGRLLVCTALSQVPPASIDCATLMDVLEHVDDDSGLLREVWPIVKPGGTVLVTVPAHRALWSSHDVFLDHRRRYSLNELLSVVRGAGLVVEERFYFNTIPLMARVAGVAVNRVWRRPERRHGIGGWKFAESHPITRGLTTLLDGDFRASRWLAHAGLPHVGLSICVVCRKPSA